jgi:hypothetical protein
VHREFLPEGKTANAEFYKGATARLLKRIQRVRPGMFCSRDFFSLHDNAPAPKDASVRQFLIPKKCYNTLSFAYFSDLSPPDYFLIPKLRS